MTAPVRTRFAPSPTGDLHIGGVRTALFSWLHARRHGGSFILRIEDTDRERHSSASERAILEGMRWLGLEYDEGPYYQSKRLARYREIIERLLVDGKAYHCYCSRETLDTMRAEAMARGAKPRYDGRCRRGGGARETAAPVVRFKNPYDGEVVVDDLIQGRAVYNNDELDDLVIARSDGAPTYNLTVVVDDLDMRISDVIRGDDHLNNTPRQINILRALDAPVPNYAHVPMILGEDGRRLSKRRAAVNVLQYRDDGYLPEALLNYLARLGWSHGDQEVFSLDEMIALFDLREVNKSAASVNPKKLLWLNQHYLKNSDDAALAGNLQTYFSALGVECGDGPDLEALVAAQKERVSTLLEMAEQSRCFYGELGAYDEKAAKKHLRPAALAPLSRLRERLSGLGAWTDEALKDVVAATATELGVKLGGVAQPLRVALTGTSRSPSIEVTLKLIGKEKTLARLERAFEYIGR